MSRPPRIHHFVPQFWIKKFSNTDGKIWAFDQHENRVRERSAKQLMQLYNLYTVQPLGIDDTTLETVNLNLVDSTGSAAFNRVLNGDYTQGTKEDLATFFAVQILRDPEIVASYNPKAQELTLSLLDAFNSTDYFAFCSQWDKQFPGASIEESEYNHIKSLGLSRAESDLELIISALDTTDGLPELPFTDVIKNPDGRTTLRNHLLTFEWTLQTDVNSSFVLGDSGALYNKGEFETLKIPLSKSAALALTPSKTPVQGINVCAVEPYEVEALNLESAARARRWLVGEKPTLERLRTQVGSSPLPSV